MMNLLHAAMFCALALSMGTAIAQETPRFAGDWNTDFSSTTIDMGEVRNVIGKDDIPSIDDPQFKPASEETQIPGVEPVVAFEHGGVARAYPLRYLIWHEIVNDVVAGLPVAVTYCPLCNSSVVFDRRLDGEAVTFGTTGKLRHSDLIMYDRGEENWWQQITGEAIVGQRAGEVLTALPSTLISFEMFRERFPDGEVLLPDPRRARMAGQNPYESYDSSAYPFLFTGRLPEDIEPMMRVALVQDVSPPAAVTLPYLRANGPVRVGDLEFRWSAGQASALDTRVIAEGTDVGNIEVVDVSGAGAEPVPYVVTFAFAARAFLPGLQILMLADDAPDPQ